MLPGLNNSIRRTEAMQASEFLLTQHSLKRVLAFTGRSIDDVVNSPLAKSEVLGFYKLHKQIWRAGEVLELEKQWNGI